MSHQIKQLRCTALTAGSAGGNFPSTIDAQSSTWGPAATPAQPGPTVNWAAKAGALAHLKPNPLSRRAPGYYAAPSATAFLTGKTTATGEIIRFGWPVVDGDKRMPFGDRRRGRPTRAILIGWLLGDPGRLMAGPFRSHKPVVRRRLVSAFVDRALKLAGAQRKVGPFEPILICSVRFMDSAVRMRKGEETIGRLEGSIRGRSGFSGFSRRQLPKTLDFWPRSLTSCHQEE